MLKTQSFQLPNFTVLSSVGERQIFLKVTDAINFIQYEGAFDSKEVRLNFDLAALYELLVKAFSKEEGYNFNMSVQGNGSMKFQLSALVGGFLKVEFDVFLKEKVMSNDGQLTVTINRLEQQMAATRKQFEEQLAALKKENESKVNDLFKINANFKVALSNIMIPVQEHFVHPAGMILNRSSLHPIDSENLELHNQHNSALVVFSQISSFFCLKFLKITYMYNNSNLTFFANESLQELNFSLSGASDSFVAVKGIENFPNLKKLSISGAPQLKDIPTVLKSVSHKIEEIEIKGCPQVNSIELQTYCQTNGIKLAIA